jgi:hypothetical protein
VAALAPPLAPDDALAFRRWCRADPVFRIDGQIAHVRVAARVSRRHARRLSTGPIFIRLQVPQGVKAEFKAMDDGFGHKYDVDVTESDAAAATADHVPVEVQVNVPMKDGQIRVRAWFEPVGRGSLAPAEDEGTANDWLVLTN